MPVHLLDVNVLVALAWPQHVHHDRVQHWFAAHADEGWATCPVTQGGFVRVSSNPKLMGVAATPDQALAALSLLTRHAAHIFWTDDVAVTDRQWIPHRMMIGYRQVTDAYLVGLAARHDGRLATLDQALVAVVPATHRESVFAIP